jgi:pimeloyl-ACP methyl ester carboxylesterase
MAIDGDVNVAEPAVQIEFKVDSSLRLVGDAWGDPKNPPVVLLHGGGQTRHAWASTAEILANAGWYAMAVDQRGHGESDWAPDGNYDRVGYAQDVVELTAALNSPPVLVGASLGGIASFMAIHLGDSTTARARNGVSMPPSEAWLTYDYLTVVQKTQLEMTIHSTHRRY